MAQGLQVFNEEGKIVQDITDRCSRVLGFFKITSRGEGFYTETITDDRFNEGLPFVIPFQNSTTFGVSWYTSDNGWQPITSSACSFYDIFLNGNTLTLKFRVWRNNIPEQSIMYGVY
ncbi:hypothetical protein I2F17_01465 [Acinetobacter sp. B10A]|uniref:hypothetical protein n=1 Tax=Acinetobacter baretiae TaxID=2605383 RepID=UPI001B3C96C8|nr:hypothetical protein [Acinetobacter baretiae]MBF7684504.1 hypothetical protein [Acinetobacter baretiae]